MTHVALTGAAADRDRRDRARRASVPPVRRPVRLLRPAVGARRRGSGDWPASVSLCSAPTQRQVHAPKAPRRYRARRAERFVPWSRRRGRRRSQDAFSFHREVGLVFQTRTSSCSAPRFSTTWLRAAAAGPESRRRAAKVRRSSGCDGDHAPGRPCAFRTLWGEKKRAAIASVLSLRPDVVLLDEPTASLDPRTKWVLVDLIQRLGAAGRTLVVATHELDIVPLIADRAVSSARRGG